MKVSLEFCLAVLVTITITQFCASQVISNGGNKEITTENGTDILVTKPELMEINLTNHELTFEVCTNECVTEFLVCYEPNSPDERTNKFFTMCENKCGFYVTGDVKLTEDNDTVYYMSPRSPIYRAEECDVATMEFDWFFARTSKFASCNPKIPENGLVELNVSIANSDCPVTIKNVKLKYRPTTTVLPSNYGPNNPSSEKSSPGNSSATNIFGNFGWISVLISIYVLQ